MRDFIRNAKWLISSESQNEKIGNRAKFFLAFPTMPTSIGNVLIHNAYIKYYSDVIGLDVSLVGGFILFLVSGTPLTIRC